MENDLIQQILNGNNDAFEQIVVKYQNLVYTICLNIVRNSHDAENMAQETFLSAYCSLSEFRGGSFKSWICKIAARKSIDFKRKMNKVLSHEETFDIAELQIPDSTDIDTQIETKDRREKLNHIISGIPGKYISVVRAYYFEQMSVKDIAQQQGLPAKTVETQLYRAKKLIRERWEENDK